MLPVFVVVVAAVVVAAAVASCVVSLFFLVFTSLQAVSSLGTFHARGTEQDLYHEFFISKNCLQKCKLMKNKKCYSLSR